MEGVIARRSSIDVDEEPLLTRPHQHRRAATRLAIITLPLLLGGAMLHGLSTRAHAQEGGKLVGERKETCPDGMILSGKKLVPGKKKQQGCCWPGQVYSSSNDQCVGVPQCPDETLLKGGTCVRKITDPEKLADIRRFLKLTGAVHSGAQSMEQMIRSYQAIMPQVPESFWVDFRREFDEEALLDLLVPIYDKHLTHDDIKALIAFYESDAGQRYLQALPDIQRDSRQAGQRFGQALAQRLEHRLKAAGYVE